MKRPVLPQVDLRPGSFPGLVFSRIPSTYERSPKASFAYTGKAGKEGAPLRNSCQHQLEPLCTGKSRWVPQRHSFASYARFGRGNC